MLPGRKIASADFLRTLAIVFVTTYHFFPDFLSNGWIGVDLFFALSGFLIFYLPQTQSLKDFLRRRFYRIVIPLILFCLLSVPLFFILFKPEFWLDVLVFPSLSAFVGAANVYFLFFQDYFNKLSYQPLLHFWSLGPEMQFIIMVALLSFLTKRSLFFSVAICIAIFSFFSNYLVSDLNSQFYLTPLRLYEFILGGCARAIYQRKLADRFPRFVIVIFNLFAIVGLLALAGGVIGKTRFEASNFALILAFVYLAFSKNVNQRGRFNTFFTGVALRSYSIYLVHYPFAFYSKTLGLSILETLPMIASSMLVAEFFYKFVDYKVITKGLDLSVLRWCLILSVLGSSFALTFFSTSDKVVSSIKVDSSYPIKEKPRVIALGDSHLPHAKLFLDKLAVPVNYVSVNCLPIPDTTHIYAATSFSQKNNKCIKQNSMWDDKYSTYDVVLLAARWSHPFIGRIDEKRVLNQWSYETRLVRANDYAPKSTTLEDSKVIFETEMDSLSAKIAERGSV